MTYHMLGSCHFSKWCHSQPCLILDCSSNLVWGEFYDTFFFANLFLCSINCGLVFFQLSTSMAVFQW